MPWLLTGELEADVVVEWTGDGFADDAEDERRERSQACFADGEVVWWAGEQDTIHNREDDNPWMTSVS